MKKILLIVTAIAFSSPVMAQKGKVTDIKSEIKMFPKAKEGFKQVYIKVPTVKNENDLKIEVFVGKTQLVDCNQYRMSGQITEKNLEGWGYNYYEVESNGQATSTMMACPDQKKSNKFISMPSETLRYNSKLPIVIYVPKNMEVKYRIWKAEKTLNNAKGL